MKKMTLDKNFNWLTESLDRLEIRLRIIGDKSNGKKLQKNAESLTGSSIQQFSALGHNPQTSNLDSALVISIAD